MSATSACDDTCVLSVEHSKVYFGCVFVQCTVESAAGAFFVTLLTNMEDGDEFSRSPWPLLLSVLSLYTKWLCVFPSISLKG